MLESINPGVGSCLVKIVRSYFDDRCLALESNACISETYWSFWRLFSETVQVKLSLLKFCALFVLVKVLLEVSDLWSLVESKVQIRLDSEQSLVIVKP